MFKTEKLVAEVGVRVDPRTRVERWQEQVQGISRSLGKNPPPNKRASLRFQLETLMAKLAAVPTMPSAYV